MGSRGFFLLDLVAIAMLFSPILRKNAENVVRKAQFWDRHRTIAFNARQRKVLNMLLDGFKGKLNSSKWYKINHCSQDTANRDIKDLMAKGVLRQTDEGGRSTNYELCSTF